MALIRGATGNYPCPICLVPNDEQSDPTKTYPLRTTEDMKEIYDEVQDLSAVDREKQLKDAGLRDIEVQLNDRLNLWYCLTDCIQF